MGVVPALDTVSQDFSARLARAEQRMTSAQGQGLLAHGEADLLRVELNAAKTAAQSNAQAGAAMLDVIDRQLSQADHTLSRPNAGYPLIVRTGDDVMVGMHDPYIYNLENSNPDALAPRVGIMYVRGVQGLFTAKTPGTVTITLTPRPGVSPAPPSGMDAPLHFTVVILPR